MTADMGPGMTPPSRRSAVDELTVRRALARVLQFVGLFTLLVGCLYALTLYLTARNHPAEAEAKLIELRSQSKPSGSEFVTTFFGQYLFEIDGQGFTGNSSEFADKSLITSTATAHYDPSDPTACIIGPLASPWPPLIAGLSIGGLVMFIASRIR